MKRAKLLYAILLVILFLFVILYRGVLSLQLFLLALLLPAVLWLLLGALRASLQASLRHTSAQVRRGDVFQWVLSVRNRSILPAPYAAVSLEYRTSLSPEKQKLDLQFPILPRNTQRVQFTFHAVTCGVLTMRITRMTVCDPLRLFQRTVLFNEEDTVPVLPAADPMLGEEWEFRQYTAPDSDTFDPMKAGDDPSEIFDLHTYREGDAVSRIYWKLSAKLDQLLVKEYSLPVSGRLLLLPDYRLVGETEGSALRLDAMLSALFTAAQRLLEQEIPFTMLHFTEEDGIMQSEPTESYDEAEAFLLSLLRQQPAPEKDGALRLSLLEDMLADPSAPDHVLLFTPRLSDEAAERLAGLSGAARLTVFAVRGAGETVLDGMPFDTVMLPPTSAPAAVPHEIVTVLTEAELCEPDEKEVRAHEAP